MANLTNTTASVDARAAATARALELAGENKEMYVKTGTTGGKARMAKVEIIKTTGGGAFVTIAIPSGNVLQLTTGQTNVKIMANSPNGIVKLPCGSALAEGAAVSIYNSSNYDIKVQTCDGKNLQTLGANSLGSYILLSKNPETWLVSQGEANDIDTSILGDLQVNNLNVSSANALESTQKRDSSTGNGPDVYTDWGIRGRTQLDRNGNYYPSSLFVQKCENSNYYWIAYVEQFKVNVLPEYRIKVHLGLLVNGVMQLVVNATTTAIYDGPNFAAVLMDDKTLIVSGTKYVTDKGNCAQLYKYSTTDYQSISITEIFTGTIGGYCLGAFKTPNKRAVFLYFGSTATGVVAWAAAWDSVTGVAANAGNIYTGMRKELNLYYCSIKLPAPIDASDMTGLSRADLFYCEVSHKSLTTDVAHCADCLVIYDNAGKIAYRNSYSNTCKLTDGFGNTPRGQAFAFKKNGQLFVVLDRVVRKFSISFADTTANGAKLTNLATAKYTDVAADSTYYCNLYVDTTDDTNMVIYKAWKGNFSTTIVNYTTLVNQLLSSHTMSDADTIVLLPFMPLGIIGCVQRNTTSGNWGIMGLDKTGKYPKFNGKFTVIPDICGIPSAKHLMFTLDVKQKIFTVVNMPDIGSSYIPGSGNINFALLSLK